MSRFFPSSTHAEDQPYSRTILTSHVIHRGAQSGALLAALYSSTRSLISTRSIHLAALARTTGYGTLVGAAVLGVGGVTGRMWGREDIEWRDRSWRLLQSKSQVEVDDFSVAGTLAGTVVGLAKRSGGGQAAAGAVRIVGMAGLGNVAGVGAYMVYRYGMKGGW